MSDLYSIDDIVASCNACGAYSLTRKPEDIKHYKRCCGIAEVGKWDKYCSVLNGKRLCRCTARKLKEGE